MIEYNRPIHQVVIFLVLSTLIGFASNLVRTDSIPWIADKLETIESIDLSSAEPVLVTISLDQAKDFFNNVLLFL